MSPRDSLSRFIVPFVGAAILTAGTLLFQIGRKPSNAPAPSPTDQAANGVMTARGQIGLAAREASKEDAFVQRLRARGL